MRTIEIDDELYEFLRQKGDFGESPNEVLRRLLPMGAVSPPTKPVQPPSATPIPAPPRQPPSSPTRPGPPIIGDSPVLELLRELRFNRGRQVVDRFLCILSWLYRRDPEGFRAVALVRGKKRVYFATRREVIELSGNKTFPVRIPKSEWFVLTNTSTDHKKQILEDVMRALGTPRGERGVILRALVDDPPLPSSPSPTPSPEPEPGDDGLI